VFDLWADLLGLIDSACHWLLEKRRKRRRVRMNGRALDRYLETAHTALVESVASALDLDAGLAAIVRQNRRET